MASGFDILAPAAIAWAVTPNDTTSFTETRGIYVGTSGNLLCDMYDETAKKLTQVTFNNLAAGIIHPIRTVKVYVASTASQIVAVK